MNRAGLSPKGGEIAVSAKRAVRAGARNLALASLYVPARLQQLMKRPRVCLYYRYPGFSRKANAIADALRTRGFDVQVCSGISLATRTRVKVSADLWIGFWNGLAADYLPRNYIFYNAESLSVDEYGSDKGWFHAMRGAREVWGYARSNEESVTKLGVPFRFVPFGYSPFYEKEYACNVSGQRARQDIDVLFYGGMSDRRLRALDELRRRGFTVRVAGWDSAVYGAELDDLIARSKVVLSIHRFDEPAAQGVDLARLDYLLSNRIFVMQERPSEMARDLDFESHVATFDYEEIGDTCAHFLALPDERERWADGAHDWFKASYALDDFIPFDHVARLLSTR